MASKCIEKCERCKHLEASIVQMFTLEEMKMIQAQLSDVWCPSEHYSNMKSALAKLRAVIAEVESERV